MSLNKNQIIAALVVTTLVIGYLMWSEEVWFVKNSNNNTHQQNAANIVARLDEVEKRLLKELKTKSDSPTLSLDSNCPPCRPCSSSESSLSPEPCPACQKCPEVNSANTPPKWPDGPFIVTPEDIRAAQFNSPLSEAMAGMFVIDETVVRTEQRIRALHATYPPDRPRATTVVLAASVNCGVDCEAPLSAPGCTNLVSVRRVVTRARHFFMQNGHDYPFVIFHQDWNDEQMKELESATGATVFWQKIIFNEKTIPPYTNPADMLPFFYQKHPRGLENPNKVFHGYGYRCMCRFFSGLIFFSPVMREFDIYLRMDAGDSRIDAMKTDIFKLFQEQNKTYGYYGWANFQVWPRFLQIHQKYNEFTGRGFHPGFGFPYPYGGKQYYNNFEMVDMRKFRRNDIYQLWYVLDESGIFWCANNQAVDHFCVDSNTLGDADVRTVQVATFFTPDDVLHAEPYIGYRHPVPDWCHVE